MGVVLVVTLDVENGLARDTRAGSLQSEKRTQVEVVVLCVADADQEKQDMDKGYAFQLAKRLSPGITT